MWTVPGERERRLDCRAPHVPAGGATAPGGTGRLPVPAKGTGMHFASALAVDRHDVDGQFRPSRAPQDC